MMDRNVYIGSETTILDERKTFLAYHFATYTRTRRTDPWLHAENVETVQRKGSQYKRIF